ncbi:MAG TPA: polyprenyl diphosphate synthase [Candidatus Levybacteria bacterium]|nr:polyprenyl diphosphate synthase [Candidatus Levybacteria bacterium]
MADLNLPNHIAIIPDGNRRWAKEHNLPVLQGHRKGAQTTIELARKIRAMGISTLTIWVFSTENWKREKDEIQGIIGLHTMLKQYVKECTRDNVKITLLGRRDRMPDNLLKVITDAEEKTKDNTKYFLNLAFDYGGHDEIIRAIRKLTHEELANLTPETFANNLDTGSLPYPNPDIVVRTGGEIRTSGFMPWQSTYTEYFFLEKYFPDLSESDIEKIVTEFGNRQRRFGK